MILQGLAAAQAQTTETQLKILRQAKSESKDVAQDRDKAKEMMQKSGQMVVPVITINGEVVVGFNQTLLDKLLSQ